METTLLHIEYLLQHHDCVILPGIGALIAQNRSARYVEESGEYLPPVRIIRFNSSISNDDGLLTNSICRRNKISYDAARTEMRRDIADLKKSLYRDGEVAIGKIGLLRLQEGNVCFSPLQSAEEMSIEIGLPILNVNALESKSEPAVENSYSDDDFYSGITYCNSDIIEEPAEEVSIAEIKRKNYFEIRIQRSIAYAAAIALLVMGICIGFLHPTDNSDKEIVEASVVPVKQLSHSAKETEKPEVVMANCPDTIASYQLIVGSFLTRGEAEEFMRIYQESDYGLQIEKSKRYWHVSAASSAEKDALLSLSRERGFATEFSQSWIRKVP